MRTKSGFFGVYPMVCAWLSNLRHWRERCRIAFTIDRDGLDI
jgi:hypothetical protein